MSELDRIIISPTDEDVDVAKAALLEPRYRDDGTQICAKEGCDKLFHSRKLCQTHYRTALRLTRNGGRKVPGPAPDPTKVRSRHNATNPQRLRDSEMYRKMNLKQNYNMTVEDYEAMLAAQSSLCLICSMDFTKDIKTPHIDHDHVTGQIRGILCHYCNLGLGQFKDNTETLKNAVTYLEKFNNTTQTK